MRRCICIVLMYTIFFNADCLSGSLYRNNKSDTIFLYMSPDGDDDYNGSIEYPIASLQRANEILEALNPERSVEVRIIGDKGEYIDHAVTWTYYNSEYYTRIVGYPNSSYAEFIASDSEPPREPFFRFLAVNGEATNLILERLAVDNYVSRPIELVGDRENPRSGWNGNNRIVNCEFSNIGNERLPGRAFTYSVIGLVNSRDNVIEHCLFTDIANANRGGYPQITKTGDDTVDPENISGDLPIIGIYLAHYCCGNRISNNIFDNVKGDCIRIRDYSNENMARNNVFKKCGWQAICTMWFCDRKYHTCTKLRAECPSYDNMLVDNIVYGNWKCEYPALFKDLHGEARERCRLQNPAYSIRIRMENNMLFVCE